MPSRTAEKCVVCGELIGVYERIYIDLGKGRIVRSSLLAISSQERRSARAYWHERHGDQRPPHSPLDQVA